MRTRITRHMPTPQKSRLREYNNNCNQKAAAKCRHMPVPKRLQHKYTIINDQNYDESEVNTMLKCFGGRQGDLDGGTWN